MANKIIPILILLSVNLYAQSDKLFIKLNNAYQTSNYQQAVELSDVVLKQSLKKNELIEVYEIRAVCFYSLGKKDSAKVSFIEILKVDNKYSPNKLFISPKIISFFNSIKLDYERIVSDKKIRISKSKINSSIAKKNRDKIVTTIAFSILLPGTGQLRTGATAKGILLTGTSVALLGSSIYFSINTKNLETDYQNESDKKLIQEKYDAYNKSYKIRNILFISYGVVWAFSQLDLLLFNQEKLFGNNFSISTSLTNNNKTSQLCLVFNYKF